MTGDEGSEAPDADADPGAQRKADHLRVSLEESVDHRGITTGLERYRLNATALPEADLAATDLTTEVFGRRLRAPVMISCMTGGTSEAGPVNIALAQAAQQHGIALGLGSGRVLLDGGDPTSFAVRDVAPDVLLMANLGAVQLAEHGVAGCQRLVEMTDADVLVLHLNAVQEAVQPDGDTDFGGLRDHLADIVAGVSVPVVVKEVGFGMSEHDVRTLVETGVSGIDVAGAGGTNWATVEGHREDRAGRVAVAFADWGWSTVESLEAAAGAISSRNAANGNVVVIASGGLRTGVDAAKCLALGADVAGFGRRLLPAAAEGTDQAVEEAAVLIDQLRIAVWATGNGRASDLNRSHLRPGQ